MTDFHRLIKDGIVANGVEDADLVVFTGGEDIHPGLYGQLPNDYVNSCNRARDLYEINYFRQAVKKGVPMLGICRGAQLLSALSGNSLIQHVDNHVGRTHNIRLMRPLTYSVNSEEKIETDYVDFPGTHHQMMKIIRDDAVLLAKAENLHNPKLKVATLAVTSLNSKLDMNFVDEAEIVHFKNVKALGIQSHPEWSLDKPDTTPIITALVKQTLFTV